MNHTGIDKVTYGVADMDAGTKFWTDFGLAPVDTGNGHAAFAAQNGAVVELRPADDPELAPPVGDDVNATVREAMLACVRRRTCRRWRASRKTAMSAKMRMAPFTPSIRWMRAAFRDADGTVGHLNWK